MRMGCGEAEKENVRKGRHAPSLPPKLVNDVRQRHTHTHTHPANSRHSSLLTGPLSFSYITLESEKPLPERALMVIGSNQHLVLPNTQREPARAL